MIGLDKFKETREIINNLAPEIKNSKSVEDAISLLEISEKEFPESTKDIKLQISQKFLGDFFNPLSKSLIKDLHSFFVRKLFFIAIKFLFILF